MYTRGSTTLCTKNSFTSSTSVDDIRAYVLSVANNLCSILGLVIIPSLTKELTYGIAYYLGKTEDDEYPLLCVANPGDNASYSYRSVYIGGVYSNLYTFESSSSFSWSTNERYYQHIIINTVSYDYTIKYIVKDDGTVVFGIGQSTTNIGYKFLIAGISNGDETCTMLLSTYNAAIYFSYCPEMGVTGISTYYVDSLTGREALSKSIDAEKDALLSCYMMRNWKVDNVLKFTNRAAYEQDTILLINGKRYVVLYYNSSYLSLLLSVD